MDSTTLVKAMRADRRHHGLTYVLGRNDCPQPFNGSEWADGGLHACRLEHLLRWIGLYPDIDHVAVVEIPDDAQRAVFATKTKASALVLTRFIPLVDAVLLALQHGADVHASNDCALRESSRHGHLSVVQCLVAHGANVRARNDYALRLASENGHLSVVQFLVARGADVHALADAALRGACRKGHLSVVEFLVAHGADVHADDDDAFFLANAHGHTEVADFLTSL